MAGVEFGLRRTADNGRETESNKTRLLLPELKDAEPFSFNVQYGKDGNEKFMNEW